MKTVNKYIQAFFDKINKSNLLYIFILANPILDLFTSLGINEKIPIIGSFGFLFRGIFLLLMIINIFFNQNTNRKKYICGLVLIFGFYLLFNINGFFSFAKFNIFAELKAFIKAFYLPVLFIGILNYFDYAKETESNNSKKIFNTIGITAYIYLALILVPAILGVGYKSYASAKQGVIGFFNSPNEIGTILAILSPVILNWLSNFKNNVISLILSFLFIYGCLIIGTKTPLLGIVIAIFANLLFVIILFIKTKDKLILKKMFYPIYWIIMVVVVLFCCSPLFSNLGWQSTLFDSNNKPAVGDDKPVIEENKPSTGEENKKPGVQKPTAPNVDSNDKEQNNENISTDDKEEVNGSGDKTPTDDKQENKEKKEKKRALELIVKKIKNLVFSSRDIYIEQGFTVFKDSSITNKMFGLGNVSLKAGYKNTVEVDLFDILFNYGIIGFIIYFGILSWAVIAIIKSLIFNSKNAIVNPVLECFITSIMIGFLIAFTAGHTMLAPAVSGYLAILIAISYHLFCTPDKNKEDSKQSGKYENVLGVQVSCLGYNELKQQVISDIKNDKKSAIVAINPEKILKARKDSELKELLNSSTYKIPDGIGVIYASKIKKGNIKARITGIDSMEMICGLSEEKSYRIFMYGAKEETISLAKKKLEEKFPKINIVGTINGYEKNNKKIIKTINDSKAQIVFVALGSPKQEYWIRDNKDKVCANIFQGVGGSFDVFSGNIKRAPKLMQKLGLEWLYRLLREPKRIFRQVKLLKFIWLVIIGKKDKNEKN